MNQIGYNEPAWKIDVIGVINEYVKKKSIPVRRAGGEYTIFKTGDTALFPDVLLFGDGSELLQGWELKFPDTPIGDLDLFDNAKEKANRLGLRSFLLWNVSTAVLYGRQIESNVFHEIKRWTDLGDIQSRADVESSRERWSELTEKILDALNEYFERGMLHGRSPVEIMGENTLSLLILNYADSVANELRQHAMHSGTLRTEANSWWSKTKQEYPNQEQWQVLAKINLLHWANRFVFCHYLKRYTSLAAEIESVSYSTSPTDVINIFHRIIDASDFANILQGGIGVEILTQATWGGLVGLNALLSELEFERLPIDVVHNILESLISFSRRKAAGQFSTPPTLARLLVELTFDNVEGKTIDPCCGTGTIARESYDLKVRSGMDPKSAISQVWAEDKYTFPVQMSSLVLSDPEQIGEVHRIFQGDALALRVGNYVKLRHPFKNEEIEVQIPKFQYIVSNLPFVRFEDLERSDIDEIKRWMLTTFSSVISDRSDYFAYFLFHFWRITEPGSRIGVIIGNSWFGTDWSEKFRMFLAMMFEIELVLVSGVGRWFTEPDMVTSIVILKRRPAIVREPTMTETTSFAYTKIDISTLSHESSIPQLVDELRNQGRDRSLSQLRTYSRSEIAALQGMGIGWSGLFTDLSWTENKRGELIPASDIFDIKRGERRGWDALFFPSNTNEIEEEYLVPCLKTARTIDRLISEPDSLAFCCSRSKAELERLGHSGALNWIESFENETNGTGERLPIVLSRSGQHWYEMRPSTMADFVISMNPGNRLFISRLKVKSFVNQRLIRFTFKNDSDTVLFHALLNSVISLFYIEALGYNRGLGALDLNATKLRENFRMLNPGSISIVDRERIITAFQPLLARDIGTFPTELFTPDRENFDRTILRAYGFEDEYESIRNALADLLRIRQTVVAV